MKKALALILACVMLASMFTVTAFAATTNVVGTHGVNNNITDGADSAAGSTNGNIQVNVTAITNKYAVDLEYTPTALNLPQIVWNVNDLKYDYDADQATAFNNADQTFVIRNYSDKTVSAEIAVTDSYTNDAINFTWTSVTDNVTGVTGTGTATASAIVNAVTVTTNTTGTAQKATFLLDVNCTDFVTAGTTHQSAGTISVATYTVTIS